MIKYLEHGDTIYFDAAAKIMLAGGMVSNGYTNFCMVFGIIHAMEESGKWVRYPDNLEYFKKYKFVEMR